MKFIRLLLRRWIIISLLVPLVSVPVIVHGALNDVVLLWGENSDETSLNFQNFGDQTQTLSPAQACTLALAFLGQNVPAIHALQEAAPALNLSERFEDCVDDDNYGSTGDFWLIYTTCSMIMGSGTYWMRWTVPPFTDEAQMIALDMSSGRGVSVPLESRLNEVRDNAPLALGTLRDYDISGPAGTKSYTLRVPEPRQYTARKYDFSYEGDIGALADIAVQIQLGKISTTGEAWIVPDAPGADVISVFYQNFRDNVVPSTGANTLLGGMMRQMAGLASQGIPVETTQTTTMRMMGVAVAFANAGAGQAQTSTSKISAITVVPSAASARCAATVIPDGMQITDLSTIMAGAASQPAGAPAMPDMTEAMNAFNQAMSSMTPEQRAAMEQFGGGLGALLGGAGGMPGAASPAAVAPAPAPARSGPSSADLMTDDLTQSVQKLLQALGYDPGSTDGEASIQTTIAISQFQAEMGVTVTGAVTPQLTGMLAAEVDRR